MTTSNETSVRLDTLPAGSFVQIETLSGSKYTVSNRERLETVGDKVKGLTIATDSKSITLNPKDQGKLSGDRFIEVGNPWRFASDLETTNVKAITVTRP